MAENLTPNGYSGDNNNRQAMPRQVAPNEAQFLKQQLGRLERGEVDRAKGAIESRIRNMGK